MAALGWAVSVLGMRASRFDLAARFADLPDTAELLHDRGAEDLEPLLAERAGFYDAIWIARATCAACARRWTGRWQGRRAGRRSSSTPKRSPRCARRNGRGWRRRISRSTCPGRWPTSCATPPCATTWSRWRRRGRGAAPTGPGLGPRDRPYPGGATHPAAVPRAVRAALPWRDARAGGANHDALDWFVTAVLPLVEAELGWETRLTVAGYLAPGVDLSRYRAHPAPVAARRGGRGGAAVQRPPGVRGANPVRRRAAIKLHEAASFGLPIVATGLLARQLGWDGALLAAETDRSGRLSPPRWCGCPATPTCGSTCAPPPWYGWQPTRHARVPWRCCGRSWHGKTDGA